MLIFSCYDLLIYRYNLSPFPAIVLPIASISIVISSKRVTAVCELFNTACVKLLTLLPAVICGFVVNIELPFLLTSTIIDEPVGAVLTLIRAPVIVPAYGSLNVTTGLFVVVMYQNSLTYHHLVSFELNHHLHQHLQAL